MRRGFLYLEILLTIGLLSVLLLVINVWLHNYQSALNNQQQYYQDRNSLINAVESGQGEAQLVSGSIYLLTVSVNGQSLSYFQRR